MDMALIFVMAIIAILLLMKFFQLGKEKKIKIINEWLLLAVIKAEKELGNGTGQVKLRFVYDLFIDKFKYTAMIMSFEQFSSLVDLALISMKAMIANNDQIKQYLQK